MIARLLPREEWPRLSGSELGDVWPYLHPEHTKVLVVENEEGEIVATWSFTHLAHVEGLWLDPAVRGKAAVARKLWLMLQELARSEGVTHVVTQVVSADVMQLVKTAGGKEVPGVSCVIPVGED